MAWIARSVTERYRWASALYPVVSERVIVRIAATTAVEGDVITTFVRCRRSLGNCDRRVRNVRDVHCYVMGRRPAAAVANSEAEAKLNERGGIASAKAWGGKGDVLTAWYRTQIGSAGLRPLEHEISNLFGIHVVTVSMERDCISFRDLLVSST